MGDILAYKYKAMSYENSAQRSHLAQVLGAPLINTSSMFLGAR